MTWSGATDIPYLVIHRSDLHAMFLRAAERSGVELVANAKIVDDETGEDDATIHLSDGSS